ncbi:hypothetical protein HY969_02360 [Candidatus Kaiserbacteria bacterium]|nr:hypothetical protein [Candidatus Kaiserbacteria bacterium]
MTEKLRHGPFPIPDQEEGFAETPVGKMQFEEIVGMDEPAVDMRLRLHMKGESIFKDRSFMSHNDTRRLEIKRIFLAALEGYGPANPVFLNWYGRIRKSRHAESGDELENVANSLAVLVSQRASDAYKKRVVVVRKEIIPEMQLSHLDGESSRTLNEINAKLQMLRMSPLSARDIFRRTRVRGRFDSDEWNTARMLHMLQLSLTLSVGEVAERLHTTKGMVHLVRRRYFRQEIVDMIHRLTGRKASK